MIAVRILRDKWIPVVVNIPGQRPIRKPLFKEIVEYSDDIAKVLISRGYVELVDKVVSEEVEVPPAIVEPLAVETKVLEEALVPPQGVQATPEPEDDVTLLEPEVTVEDEIVSFLRETEIEAIAEKVKGIGIATAKKLKALESISLAEIEKILTEKQIESLANFVKE